MYHCFVAPEDMTDSQVLITGEDVNHIKNVCRLKTGDDIYVSDGTGRDVLCSISAMSASEIIADIISTYGHDTELSVKITLYQGLPKSDKLESIIQKCVELGAYRIVPVETARCVAKLDGKKAASRRERWQKIAESAAKQCQRGMIPEVGELISFKQALKEVSAQAQGGTVSVIPYELCEGTETLKKLFSGLSKTENINIFIGPEGGFETSEVEAALAAGVTPITLGRRILRTETAGMALIAGIMLQLEMSEER